jgi:hypothetical protein
MLGGCKDDDDPEIRYDLLLTTPAANAVFSSVADPFTPLVFGWTPIDKVSAYTLKIAKTEAGLATTAVTHDKGNSNSHTIATAADFEALLRALGFGWEETAAVWWTVVPTVANDAVDTYTRSFSATRGRNSVTPETPAVGAEFSSDAGAFVPLTFSWTLIGEVDAYTLKIAKTELGLATTTVKYDKGNSSTHTIAAADDFDALLQALEFDWGETAPVWWTVVPTAANDGVNTYTRSFSAARRQQSEIGLVAPADNVSVNAYVVTFPVTFTWNKIPEVTGYTLKLSPTGDFTTPEAFTAFDAGNNNSYSLDKATCEGLLAAIATNAGAAYTGKVNIQWTVEPSASQPEDIKAQTRTLAVIGGESAFPYELNDDNVNGEGWTATSSVAVLPDDCAPVYYLFGASANGTYGPGNLLLGSLADNHYLDSYYGALNPRCAGGNPEIVIDMQKVKTVTSVAVNWRGFAADAIIHVKCNAEDEWTSVGTIDLPVAHNYTGTFPLSTPVEARYVKILNTVGWPSEGDNCWSHNIYFNRVWVYGSNNGE